MSKPRIHIRLSTKLYARLCEASDRPGATKAQIVEDALMAWFDPHAQSILEERLLKRLDSFDLRQSEIERDVAFTFETLAHFIFYWLTRTEPIPDGERDVAHALGQRRFDYFISQVVRRIAEDPISRGGSRSKSPTD